MKNTPQISLKEAAGSPEATNVIGEPQLKPARFYMLGVGRGRERAEDIK